MELFDNNSGLSNEIKKTVNGGQSVIVRGSGLGKKAKQQQVQSSSTVSVPTEVANNRRSKAFAQILALLGEGEIQGAASDDLLKNIYLDETPIKNQDGSLNFQNVIIDFRYGTQDQSYIPSVGTAVSREVEVGVQIKKTSGSVVRAITDSNIDAILIRLATPALTFQQDDGTLVGSEITFTIELSSAGQQYQLIYDILFSGKVTSTYQLPPFRVQLVGNPPWNIRITRTADDSTATRKQNDLYWQAYTEIIDTKFRYPNSVLLAITIDSEQFQSIPKIGIKLKGIIIKVPHNYNPERKTYSGIFDGTLVRRYSNNPAWILYDMLTSDRYGCGRFIDPDQVDIWDLYSIGQYCDELVPDGRGGYEPRFVCNAYLQTRDDAYKVLEAIASCFRGLLYESGSAIHAIQDKPRDVASFKLYTQANVVHEYDEDGKLSSPPFNYSGTSLDARHTVALVSWSDPTDFYRTKVEVVRDNDAILRYGYNPTEIVAFGCTSKGQAQRMGRWTLLSEHNLTQTITFKVGAEGLLVAPGEGFKVMDSLKSTTRLGGRIKSATLNSVTLDSTVAIASGKTYTLSVILSDGTAQTRNVTNSAGSYTILTVSSSFTEIPRHIWILEASDLKAQLYQCISCTETSDHVYEITGIEYNNSIYSAVDNKTKIEEIPTTGFPDPRATPLPPSNLIVNETLYEKRGGGVSVKLDLTWQASPSSSFLVKEYEVSYKSTAIDAYKVVEITQNFETTIVDLPVDIYDFQVRAVSYFGKYSQGLLGRKQIMGLNTLPSDVNNFSVRPLDNVGLFTWDLVPELDVKSGGNYIIKHTFKTNDFTWSDGVEIGIISGGTNNFVYPLSDGAYLIKAVDSQGNQSLNVRSVQINYSFVYNLNIVETVTEHPAFIGNKTNLAVIDDKLRLSAKDYIDQFSGNWDSLLGNVDNLGAGWDDLEGNVDNLVGNIDSLTSQYFSVVESGVYEFSRAIDLGRVHTCRISLNFAGYSTNETRTWDAFAGNVDSIPGTIDGNDLAGSYAVVQVAISQDAVTYANFENFKHGDYYGRAFKFRLLLFSGDNKINYYVENLEIIVDMPDRIESKTLTSAVDGFTVVTFGNPFWSIPEVGITILNGQTGDYIDGLTKTNTGFAFFLRRSNTFVTQRNFTYFAKGY